MEYSEANKITKDIIDLLLYDNQVSLSEVVELDEFKEIVKKICNFTLEFFSFHTELISDDKFLNTFVIGEQSEIVNYIQKYPELFELNSVLDDLFDIL